MRRKDESTLERARRQARRGSVRVSKQRALIARLARRGQDIGDAMSTLRAMRDSLQSVRADVTREELAAHPPASTTRDRPPDR